MFLNADPMIQFKNPTDFGACCPSRYRPYFNIRLWRTDMLVHSDRSYFRRDMVVVAVYYDHEVVVL